ncbi:nicotinate-nucleotide pyrophosphorylase [Desulfotomaculum defluvii]
MELRDFLFEPLKNQVFQFVITANQEGIFSGANELRELLNKLSVDVDFLANEGTLISKGKVVFRGRGEAEEVVRAEEMLLGVIGKPSGVASTAAEFIRRSEGKIKIVCGAWKKVTPPIRPSLRQAIATGGAGGRITDNPFIYLDKNYVRMFGGVGPAVRRAKQFIEDREVSVQIKGERQPIVQEAQEAYLAGAGILMVDTGNVGDLKNILDTAAREGWRSKVKLAFGGGATLDELPKLISTGADIVDVGRGIIDAPMLDFSLDVTSM